MKHLFLCPQHLYFSLDSLLLQHIHYNNKLTFQLQHISGWNMSGCVLYYEMLVLKHVSNIISIRKEWSIKMLLLWRSAKVSMEKSNLYIGDNLSAHSSNPVMLTVCRFSSTLTAISVFFYVPSYPDLLTCECICLDWKKTHSSCQYQQFFPILFEEYTQWFKAGWCKTAHKICIQAKTQENHITLTISIEIPEGKLRSLS